jgi:hypothetical protein
MNDRSRHAEWLNLLDISGPFLAEPVLNEAFVQGLPGLDPEKRRLVRQAYAEWRDALDEDDADFLKIHSAWIDLVLKRVLELDEDSSGEVLKSGATLPQTLCWGVPGHGISLAPDYAVLDYQPSTSFSGHLRRENEPDRTVRRGRVHR